MRLPLSKPKKRCTRCQTLKLRDAFAPRAASRDGLHSWCRDCYADAARARTARTPIERRTEKARKYYVTHREKRIASARAYNVAHPEKVKERTLKWRALKWPVHLAAVTRSRARKLGLEFDLTASFLEALLEKQDGRCHWLGVPLVSTSDKRDPSRPSIDRLDCSRGCAQDNVVLACMFANLGRSTVSAERMASFVSELRVTMQLVGHLPQIGRSCPRDGAGCGCPCGSAGSSRAG